jgi:hypothetical protein
MYTSPLRRCLSRSNAALEAGATLDMRRRAKKPNKKEIL